MLRRVDADLVYATAASCADLPPLPAGAELEALLLPADAQFQGHAQLSKIASGAGCALYLSVDGAAAAEDDAFDSAAKIDARMAELVGAKALRGVATWDLQLSRATIRVDDKSYSLSMDGAPAATSSLLTLGQSSGACAELLAVAQQMPSALLPENVQAGSLQVSTPSVQLPAFEQQLAQCLVQLDIVAQTEGGLTNAGAFQLLKDLDVKIEEFVGTSGQIQSASVHLTAVKPSNAPETPLSLASSGATSSTTNLEYNPPSTQMALGIFVGFMMLTAMLLGVVFTKKQHEKRCRDRYERANRAAQIHRVTLRMTQRDEDANDEEDDSLL